MNKIWISTLLLTLTTAISAAPIFECTDSAGRKVYTQAGGKNCKASNIGKPSVYTSAPVSTPATPISPSKTEQAEEAVAPVNPADVGAAKRALDTAKKNLEEGKKVRYGNERNYARYLERIKGLEKPSARLRKTMTRRNTSLHLKILLPIDPYHTSKAV